uniref:Uncharacterized protein n=1 Tax=Anguilla anguilla TaxID=7936 RepID=A0A0E9TJ64_ANGAN
MSLFLLLVVF